MTEHRNGILSDGTDEGTARCNVDVPDMDTFRVYIGMVEDESPIREKIELENVLIWLWNAPFVHNNRWKLHIAALGSLVRTGPYFGLPRLRNDVEDGSTVLCTGSVPRNFMNERDSQPIISTYYY